MDSLQRSKQLAEEMLSSGNFITEEMTKQDEALKKIKRRTLQMLNSIGMSESILKLIDRRSKIDFLIFIGLVLFTLAFLYVLLYYVKPMLSLDAMLFSSSSVA